MAQATDFTISNASFPSVRTDLNTVLGAINSSNSGTSRPSSATTGTFWLDTSSSGSNLLILKFFDGSDDITFATFNTSSSTVDVSDSSFSGIIDAVSPSISNNTGTLGFTSPNFELKSKGATAGNFDIHTTNSSGTTARVFRATHDGHIQLMSADTVIGKLSNSSSDFVIENDVQDKDILFKGDDGGSGITALSLDMSDAGTATFNHDIKIADGGQIGSASDADAIAISSAGVVTFSGAANVGQQALTSSSNAVAWDASAKPNAYHLTTENTTFAAPSNAVEGAFIALEINYDGSHTIAFNTVFEFAGSTAPTFTSTDGKTDILVFKYNGSVWQEVGRTLNLSES